MRTAVRPGWLVLAALLLTISAALAFTRGWHWAAIAMLLLASPLDLIAERLAMLRLRPLPANLLSRRLLWPAGGLALLGLGWFQAMHGSGWGALVSAISAGAFAQALRIEAKGQELPAEQWLFGCRQGVFLAVPFAILGWWNGLLAALALYAAASFFIAQNWVHRADRD